MGEAKRRKQLDPSYGKTSQAVKYVINHLNATKNRMLQDDCDSLRISVNTNNTKGFTFKQRQEIANHRSLFANDPLIIIHAENLGKCDVYLPNLEPLFNANYETIKQALTSRANSADEVILPLDNVSNR